MNWKDLEGRWDQITGQVRSKWGSFTPLTNPQQPAVDPALPQIAKKLPKKPPPVPTHLA